MLDDADIARWSRQILLPEVGGRGQERLLAARIAVVGDGPLAAVARDLLARSGVRAAADGSDVLVAIGAARAALARQAVATGAVLVAATQRRAGGTVWTLVGRPCGACLDDDPPAPGPADPALEGIAAQALGALVANEVLCALLVPPTAGRGHRLDLAAGRYEAATPRPAAACDVCGGRA